MSKSKSIIIGGDSLIGTSLREELRSKGYIVKSTTRRRNDSSADNIFLDLLDQDSIFSLNISGFKTAYFCAGITRYLATEIDEGISRQVNVTNTLTLCQHLVTAGVSVIFLSSAAVFDGESPFPREGDSLSPITLYGIQKAEVERALRELNPKGIKRGYGTIKIVRISKILSPYMPLLTAWRKTLFKGQGISPLRDLRVSPVSLAYVVDALIRIANIDNAGIFHLSGACDVTYADIARELLTIWRQPLTRLTPLTIESSGIYIPYAPRFPTLSMTGTTGIAAIHPQQFTNCIREIAN